MSQRASEALRDTLSETDEPSLESRVADNLMVVARYWAMIAKFRPFQGWRCQAIYMIE